MEIRNRIKELRFVKARDLLRNRKNWRKHPESQASALRAILEEIGYADVLLTREVEGGRLEIFDGHLRADITPETEVPCIVTDLTEAEAEKMLLLVDPLAAMAKADRDALRALAESVQTESEALRAAIDRTLKANNVTAAADDTVTPQYPIVPTFGEKYDCVVIIAKNETDLAFLQTVLQLRTEQAPGGKRVVGTSHVLPAERFAELWKSR